MNPQLTFVARLRRTRERNGVSLDQIAAQTRVLRELLQAFEDNDLTNWPRGLYARAWVRGYALAVGLDPADTVDEFCRLYAHGDRRARPTMREMAVIHEAPARYRDDHDHEERRQGMSRAAAGPVSWYAPIVAAWRAVRTRVATLWATLFARPGGVSSRAD